MLFSSDYPVSIGLQSSRGEVYNCFFYKQCIENIWAVIFNHSMHMLQMK